MSMFKKTYKITIESEDRERKNTSFIRGYSWNVVLEAMKNAKEKTEKKEEGKMWAVTNIERI